VHPYVCPMPRVVIAAVVFAAVACNHTPTAPGYGARGSHIQYGRAVSGLLNAPDTARFYLDATAGEMIAAYAGSPDTNVLISFTDSGNGVEDVFLTNHHGITPGTKAAFTYLVPNTGAFSVAMVRPERQPGQVEFEFVVDTVYIGPEHIKPAITVGQIVSGESIDSVGDIDVFTFNGTAGKQVIGYLQATGDTSGVIQMHIYRSNPDSVLAATASQNGDSSLEDRATNAITLPNTGTYHVRIEEASGTSYVGPYRFEVYQIDSAPESISSTVSPGDTVQGESIDHVGDVDVFTVNAKAGAKYNLFAQTLGATRNIDEVDALDASGHTLATVTAVPGAALTDGPGSGVFTPPANGQFTIRVQNTVAWKGPYRFFLYPINSAPEIAPATFTLGDSVTTETIELPGDVDVFTMNVTRASLATVCATYGTVAVAVAGISTLGQNRCTIGFQVQPGTYTVNAADPPGGSYRGRYTLTSWAYTAAPEHVSPMITLGDTVKGESIDAPGDYDVFTLNVKANTLVTVSISAAPVVQPTWSLTNSILYGGDFGPSGFIKITTSGTQQFTVGGANVGPYSFVITPWPTAPEHVPAVQPLGGTISGESIDYSWDVDQFTLTAPPGTLALFSINNKLPPPIDVQILSPDSSTVLSELEDGPVQAPTYSQRFTVPSTGTVLMRVYGAAAGETGPYSITTTIVNPGPEHVSASTAIGDTVSGESIDYPGDLDQFMFSGTAGQKINVYLRTPGGTSGITLQLLAQDGTVLGQVQSFNDTPLANQSTGTVTLPTTGTYSISVSGSSFIPNDGTYGTGPYVFAILPSS